MMWLGAPLWLSKYKIEVKIMRICGFPALHHSPSPQQAPKRPRIAPSPVQHRISHRPPTDRLIIQIRDLKLATTRRLECLDHIEHAAVIDIQPCHSIIRLRNLGLLLNAQDLPTVFIHLSHTKTRRVRYWPSGRCGRRS